MSFRKRTNAYWEKRAQEQLTYLERQVLPYLKQIDAVFRNAQKANLASVKDVYLNYYKSQGWDTTNESVS